MKNGNPNVSSLEAHIDQITERYRNGESAGLIADSIPGATRDQIIGLMWRRKIKRLSREHVQRPRGAPPRLDAAAIQRIHNSDASNCELARTLGVSRFLIAKVRLRRGCYAEAVA